MELSRKSAEHKFKCMKGILPKMKLWYGKRTTYKPIAGKLIEAVEYEDGNMHVFYYGNGGVIKLPMPPKISIGSLFNPTGISFSFIHDESEPYLSLYKEAHKYYNKMHIYGLPISVHVCNDVKPLDMAKARNLSLSQCQYDTVFILDVDVRISESTIEELVALLVNTYNSGVFNLKNDFSTGNGLYLGQKNALMANGFDERFKGFWYEDTEYLMNFSKMGIIPKVYFRDFDIIDHSRDKTSPHWKRNQKLFKKLALEGRNT